MANSGRRTAITVEVLTIGVPVTAGSGFLLGWAVGWSLSAAEAGLALGTGFALPICAVAIWTRIRAEEAPPLTQPVGWRLTTGVAAALFAVITAIVVWPSGKATPGPSPTAASPNPQSSASASASAQVQPSPGVSPSASASPSATDPSATDPSAGGSLSPVPNPVPAKVSWPTSANDGSPAMNMYFGSEFFFPDWVSCEDTYCLAGQGKKVHVYTQHPIKRISTFNGDVPDPYQTLLGRGFTVAQARALLKMD